MKTRIYRLIIACALVSLVACDVDKITSLKDDFKFSFSPDAVGGKLTIQVQDEFDGETSIPQATITFTGEGSESIYTPAGKNSFETLDGILTVGLTAGIEPTKEEPIIYGVKIEAPGYNTLETDIVFDGEEANIISFPLRKQGVVPNGSKLVSITGTMGADGLTSNEVVLENAVDVEEPTTITIEAGTAFEDEDGNPITGTDFQVELQTFDTGVEGVEGDEFENPGTASFSSIPDGGFYEEDEDNPDVEVVDESEALNSRAAIANASNAVNSTTFVPIGNPSCYYLYVNGVKVYSLSRDTKVKTYFNTRNGAVVNPFTKQPATVGDVVDVYRRVRRYYKYSYWSWWGRRTYYRYRYSYQATGKKGVVNKDSSGNFYVEYTTRYTGVHYFGFTGENIAVGCSSDSFEKLKFENTGRRTAYYFILRQSDNNRYLGFSYAWIGEQGLEISKQALNYYSFRHFKKMYDGGVKLTAYGYNFTTRRYEKVYDKETTLCDLASENVDLKTSECVEDYNIEMKVDCPSVSVVFNDTPVYFRKEGDRWFRYYHSIRNGFFTGKAACLDENTNYEFRLRYDQEWQSSPLISGKDVKEVSIEFNTDKVCEIIENR